MHGARTISTLAITLLVAARTFAADPAPAAAQAPNQPAAAPAAAPAKLDLSFIPSTACAAIVIQPQRLFTTPEMALFPTEVVSTMCQKAAGIEPLDIEQAVMILEPGFTNQPPPYGVIAKFAKPFNADTVAARLGPKFREISAPSGRFFQSEILTVYMVNDRWIVSGTPHQIERMMSADGADSPLLKMLNTAYTPAQILAVASLDMMRGDIEQLMQSVPPMPPPFVAFRTLPERIAAAQVMVRVADTAGIALLLDGKDQASAEMTEQMLKQAIALGRAAVKMQSDMQARGSNDEVEQAAARYTARVTDYFFDLIKVKRDGIRVTVSTSGVASPATFGGLMVAMLPALQMVRESSRGVAASANLKQIWLAMAVFENQNGKFPPRYIASPDGRPLLSWRVAMLPFLEQQALYKEFHLDEPWDSPHNRTLIERMPAVFASPGREAPGMTCFQVPVGRGTVFEGPQSLGLRDVRDGVGMTLLLLEVAPERAVPWTKPDDYIVDFNQPLSGLQGSRRNGFYVGFCDGNVRLIDNSIDPEVLAKLFTASADSNGRFPGRAAAPPQQAAPPRGNELPPAIEGSR